MSRFKSQVPVEREPLPMLKDDPSARDRVRSLVATYAAEHVEVPTAMDNYLARQRKTNERFDPEGPISDTLRSLLHLDAGKAKEPEEPARTQAADIERAERSEREAQAMAEYLGGDSDEVAAPQAPDDAGPDPATHENGTGTTGEEGEAK